VEQRLQTRYRCAHRRGLSQAATLLWIALAAGAAISTAAMVPRLVRAGDPIADHAAEAPRHRLVADALVAIIAGSHEVMVIGAPGFDDRQEIVLWTPADPLATTIRPDELIVLFFSPVLEAVTAHTHRDSEGDAPMALGGTINPVAMRAPDFPARFRALPTVERRVIASGIASMRLSVLSDNEPANATLRLDLTFSEESADGVGAAVRTLTGIRLRR